MGLLEGLSLTDAPHLTGVAAATHAASTTIYGSHAARAPNLHALEMPEEEMEPRTAYQLIKDELTLDGNPTLNLASFCTTFAEDELLKLMTENCTKNFIDFEEYPSTVTLHNRVVNMLARLFHAPKVSIEESAVGTSTIGSSEGIMLAVLAMKRRWQEKRKAANKEYSHPNLVMSSTVQVCWEKACCYFEIEERPINITEGRYVIDPIAAAEAVDENTIGVVAIFGSTYTGEYDDVKGLSDALDKVYDKDGELDVPIHVDAASGGFIAPFINPGLEWDFRVNRVASINVSGHKAGLVPPGVGWVLWRSKVYLPEELIFHINYLGADQASFTLNFSKSASNVIGQYYILVRNGKAGFRAIVSAITETADWLHDALEATGIFDLLSQKSGKGVPLVAFKLKPGIKHYNEHAIADRIRERGWIIPAYTLAPAANKMMVLRAVIRQDMSRGRAMLFFRDLINTIDVLDAMSESSISTLVKSATMNRMSKKSFASLPPALLADVAQAAVEAANSAEGGRKTHAIC